MRGELYKREIIECCEWGLNTVSRAVVPKPAWPLEITWRAFLARPLSSQDPSGTFMCPSGNLVTPLRVDEGGVRKTLLSEFLKGPVRARLGMGGGAALRNWCVRREV